MNTATNMFHKGAVNKKQGKPLSEEAPDAQMTECGQILSVYQKSSLQFQKIDQTFSYENSSHA